MRLLRFGRPHVSAARIGLVSASQSLWLLGALAWVMGSVVHLTGFSDSEWLKHLERTQPGLTQFGTARTTYVSLDQAANPKLTSTVSIPDDIRVRSDTVAVPVRFKSEGVAVAALQVDLTYDQNAFAITAIAGQASVAAGKSLTTVNLPGGGLRLVVAGVNGNTVSDGSIAELSIQVRPGARPGRYALEMHNEAAADPSAEDAPIRARSGYATVGGTKKN